MNTSFACSGSLACVLVVQFYFEFYLCVLVRIQVHDLDC